MKYWSFVDEEKMLEKLLKDPNDINKDTNVKVKLLIKHYKRQGLSKNEIRRKLDEFMMEYCKGFILADWDDTLRRYVNKFTKKENCEFKKTNDVVIYKEELDFISSKWEVEGVNSIEIEKLLFVILVLAKSNGNGSWLNYNDKIVFDLARYKFKKGDRKLQKGNIFYHLGHYEGRKILECMLYSKNGSIKIFYNREDGEEVMRIKNDDDIENVILRYLDWRKYPMYAYCECCGKEIKIKHYNDRSKYCSKCSKEIDKKNKLKYYYKNKS
jgi:hypothetical protein